MRLNFLWVYVSLTGGMLSQSAFSDTDIVMPLGTRDVAKFLDDVKDLGEAVLGFNPRKAGYGQNNREGSCVIGSEGKSLMVYDIDVDNDTDQEIMVISINERDSLAAGKTTGRILSVFDRKNGVLTKIDVPKIFSESLRNSDSTDLSNIHSNLAAPFIVKREGRYIMRFYDSSPKPIFTEYTWFENKLNKLKVLESNIY